jgi:hypothetical protein
MVGWKMKREIHNNNKKRKDPQALIGRKNIIRWMLDRFNIQQTTTTDTVEAKRNGM